MQAASVAGQNPRQDHEPTPKRKPKTSISPKHPNPNRSSSSSSGAKSAGLSLLDNEEDSSSSATVTLNRKNTSTPAQNSESETDPRASKILISIACVKDSDDPFQDFKNSMLQMILEKNIYSKDDLEELLNCFLELNSPCHHNVIVQAFTEIWKEITNKPCARCVPHES
uniref:Transcription repressor n=1 Tax=Salix viminalis TaxID=40686 RepID=A0A6N2LKT5_SALVM